MKACGDADDCISTSEAIELAEKLDDKEINNLPRPGQVEFINGGPPCQVWLTSSISDLVEHEISKSVFILNF